MGAATDQTHSDRTSSCGRPPDRRERRRTETRERIIRHALRLFAEHGVTATTVEDITNAADVGKGTFFNYFPSKEHILAHLCQLQMGKIEELISQAIHSTESLDRVLYQLAATITEEFGGHPAMVQGVLVPSLCSETMRQQMADEFERDRFRLAELMAARQERREIREDLAPNDLALQFQQAVFGTTVLWSLNPSKPLSTCLREMISVLWLGIRTRETSPGFRNGTG